MKQATAGDTVRVHYTGTLDNGTTFDTSADRDPMEITLGSGQILSPGVEDAILGMTEGDVKTVTLEAENAFGPHNPDLIQHVERARIPDEIALEVGAVLQATDETGNPLHLNTVLQNAAAAKVDAVTAMHIALELEKKK